MKLVVVVVGVVVLWATEHKLCSATALRECAKVQMLHYNTYDDNTDHYDNHNCAHHGFYYYSRCAHLNYDPYKATRVG